MMSMIVLDSCVRGHHIYKDSWTPVLGEALVCVPEFGNVHDPYAVAVCISSGSTVGHVPRNISALCHFFIRRCGTITCQVTGVRRYSSDLLQGGLEVPCTYTFEGIVKEVDKVRKLLKSTPSLTIEAPPCKKLKKEDIPEKESPPADAVWLTFSGQILTEIDKKVLTECDLLNDRHINFAQRLLRSQFPDAQGLGHTLLQQRKTRQIEQGLQIVFDRGNHWIVASNMDGTVKVYDSIYTYIDGNTRKVIENLFCMPEGFNIEMLDIQKQKGVKDCGLFSIAIATALLFGEDPSNIRFNQVDMRNHLLKCYDTKFLSLFSVL